jgi:hypothetical protein
MLFKARFHPGIIAGSITRTFRRWKRLQVVPGNRYRQTFGELEVVSAEEVRERSITARDAELAGYASGKPGGGLSSFSARQTPSRSPSKSGWRPEA